MFTALGKQKGLFFFGVIAFLVIVVVVLIACLNNGRPTTGEEILASVPTVVGKSGWSYVIRSDAAAANNISNLSDEPWDYAGLTASSVRAQFYSVGASNCSEAQYKDAVTQTLDQIDMMHRVFEKYEEYFIPGSSAKDISSAGGSKSIAGFLAVDGGYALDSRMSVLRDYYRLGVRSVALGGRCSTPWSTSPLDNNTPANTAADDGFLNRTTFGEKVIPEMNRLGMLIDLTGTTKETQLEAIRISRAPVIFSSSASNNITEHDLNVDDDVLIELNARGGIIMVPFNSDQVCNDLSNCTVNDIIAHIEHIWEVTNSKSLIGLGGNVGMLGIGSQSLEYPQGYSDSWGYVTLFNKLLQNGNWTVNDLQDLAGNNFARVLRSVEQISRDDTNQAPAEVPIDLNDIPQREQGCYTGEGPLMESSALNIARAFEGFHNRLYSFQNDPASGSTIPSETTAHTAASTDTSMPSTTTSAITTTDGAGSTTPSGSTIPSDTTANTGASTDTSTPSTSTTARTTADGVDSTTPSGSSVATCMGYIVICMQLLHLMAL